MKWVVIIGIIVAFTVVASLGVWFVTSMFDRWVLHRNPDYHRQLPNSDAHFINNAKLKLEAFAQEGSYKKPSNWLIYMSNLPIMLFVFGAGFYLLIALSDFRTGTASNSNTLGTLVFAIPPFPGISMIIGIFAGILIAGWLTYFITSFDKKFTAWMVLTQSSTQKGESEYSILERRKTQIEHDVRVRKLDIRQAFSPTDFLGSIARRHGQYCLLLSLPLLIPAMFLLFFDLRDQTNFYTNGLSYTEYWNGDQIDVRYDGLDHVEIECAFGHNNRLDSGVYFISESDTVAQYPLKNRHIETYAELDQQLRNAGVEFKAHYWHPPKQGPKLAYTRKCLEKRASQLSADNQAMIEKILHIGEIIP